MIDELLRLHEIKYVISVDDCYFNPDEENVKAVLASAMYETFMSFREYIEKMGKKELLDNVEQMIQISGQKDALIKEFLEEFTFEQLLELYRIAPTIQGGNYTDERERLISFLEMLKEEGCVEEYEVCSSTKDALEIDYEKKALKDEGILWLIDRNFERVGESPEAGIELAKTIVSRNDGPTNYVYVLSSLEEDKDKTEEVIETEFDKILLTGCDEKTASFIYYLYKQRIIPEKPAKIAKGLAQGFKRKACFELFDLYVNSIQISASDSSKCIHEIRQNTLNYLFDEMVRENGESYSEFLTRFVNIFQMDSYQKALADSNEKIMQKLYYYKRLCRIADDKVQNKKAATEKVKVFRELELYNKHVNRQQLEVSTGDIFRIGEMYYFLASQPCDTCLRGDGTRILENASLLLISDDSSKPPFSYKLSCFSTYVAPIVKYQSQLSLPFEILDLCVSNKEGRATLSSDLLFSESELQLEFFSERYRLRMQQVVSRLKKVANNSSLLEKFFANEEFEKDKVRQAYEDNRMINPELLKYKVMDGMFSYDVQRVCRLDELVSIDIVNMLGINLSRIGHSFDFTERTRRNS